MAEVKRYALILWLLLASVCCGQTQSDRVPPLVRTHATVAAMVLKPAPPESIHQTVGYATAGVGAGTYIYHRTGRPTADGGFYHNGPQADDYYELVDKTEANALQFGATGDTGDTDDHARLQACIDAGGARRVPIYIPATLGDYDISAPLWWTSTASATNAGVFYTAYIYGGGMGSTGNATAITANFNDRPATAIQMARDVTISDLNITGANLAPATARLTLDRTYANWITAGLRDSRYSPQCGIAIDPTVGTTPADGGYPSMTYIGNTTSGSNDIRLIRVSLRHHVVGVVLRPDGQSNQVDAVRLRDCKIQQCATSYASCNSQSRSSSSISDTEVSNAHTFIDTLRYGAQTGTCPNVSSSQFVGLFRLIRVSHAPSNISWSDCYAESIREIGICGTGSSVTKGAALFTGLQLNFETSTGRSPFIISAFMPVKFVGCTFKVAGDSHSAVINFQGANIECDTCSFVGTGTPKFIGLGSDNNVSVRFKNCVKGGSVYRLVGLPNGGTAINQPSPRLEPERNSDRWFQTQAGLRVWVPGSELPYASDTPSNASALGAQVTFDVADPAKWLVGDYILGDCTALDGSTASIVPAFYVSAKNGSTITADALFYTAAISNYHARIALQEWAPGQALTGDTNSNTSITNVSPTTIVAIGDWIAGTGIPASTRVTNVSGSTVTISKNATATAAGVSLFFGRVHTVTTSAAF